ncbi:MAG: hypothetical protein JO044_15535 [Mycobacteriaceae bacterium]|nr:hypothetical protein [Mycobacteriaceae bacterium]MBV9638290.1 hypothetical protein [Mycobacteriaceae bacterium]
MSTCRTSRAARHAACAALVTAALAAGTFAQTALARADYDSDYYNWCIKYLDQGQKYCCSKAGGDYSSGQCAAQPAAGPTASPPVITQTVRPFPPVIIAPPAP